MRPERAKIVQVRAEPSLLELCRAQPILLKSSDRCVCSRRIIRPCRCFCPFGAYRKRFGVTQGVASLRSLALGWGLVAPSGRALNACHSKSVFLGLQAFNVRPILFVLGQEAFNAPRFVSSVGRRRSTCAPLCFVRGPQAFNARPEGAMSSQPRASERSEATPWVTPKRFRCALKGQKQRQMRLFAARVERLSSQPQPDSHPTAGGGGACGGAAG